MAAFRHHVYGRLVSCYWRLERCSSTGVQGHPVVRLRIVPHAVLSNATPLALVLQLPNGPSVSVQPQQATPFDWQPLRKRPQQACLLVEATGAQVCHTHLWSVPC